MKKNKNIPKKKSDLFSYFFFLILIVLIPNLFYSDAMDEKLEIRMLGLGIFLSIVFLIALFSKKETIIKQNELKILKNPVVLIYTFFILFIGLSIFWSTNKSEALYEFLKRLAFFVLFLYLIIYVLPKENSRSALIKSFIIFSILISLVGVFQIFGVLLDSKFNIGAIYSIKGNFAHKNIYSEVLFITFAFTLYGITLFEKAWKNAAIAGTLLNILLIVFLMTRAIWTGFFVALIFSIILYVYFARKNDKVNKLKPIFRYLAITFGVAIIAVIIILLTDKNKTIQHQFSSAGNFKEGNTFYRVNLWKKSLSLAKEYPVLGVGAGNWRIEILRYDLEVYTEGGKTMPDRSHNDFLQVFAENGAIGLLSFLSIFIFLLYFCIKTLKKAKNPHDSFFIIILFFVLLGYIVDSCFSFPRERIELQIFLNVIFALIVFEYNKFKVDNNTLEKKSQISIQAILAVVLCLMITSSYAAYKRLSSEVGVKKIYAYDKLKNDDKIIKTADEIYSAFSTITPYGDPILGIKARSLYKTESDSNLVLEAFEGSLKDSPHHLQTFNDLAIFYMINKNYSKAFEYCKIALQYAPYDNQTLIIKSKIYLSSDKIDDAYNILRKINPNRDPSNLQDYKKTVNFILINKVMKIFSLTKNDYFNSFLKSNSEKPEFLYDIYAKSVANNEMFERVLLDTIIPLCDQEKINNDESIKQLKLKLKF